jgi:hypothetical protein
VARSNPRLAAGVGIVSLFLLLGGPAAAVVSADPGGGHSDRGNSSNKNGNGHGRGNSQTGGAKGDDNGGRPTNTGKASGGGDHSDSKADLNDNVATPKARVGSGRDDQQPLSPSRDVAPDNSRAGLAPDQNGGAPGATGPADIAGRVGPGVTGGAFQPPRVTFGNGRTPGVDIDDASPDFDSPTSRSAPDIAPPPPPSPAPAPPSSWVDRIATSPAPTRQLGVAPASDLSDPLWGVAGLLLIPAAGAVLGYRQARAAQAVERMRQS